MLLNILLTVIFSNNFILAAIKYSNYTDFENLANENEAPRKVPFLIKEPFGPKSNGPLRLERLDNMNGQKRDVVLNLESGIHGPEPIG